MSKSADKFYGFVLKAYLQVHAIMAVVHKACNYVYGTCFLHFHKAQGVTYGLNEADICLGLSN